MSAPLPQMLPRPEPQQHSLIATGPRITQVEIARLHNLGNYEHVRYQLKLELPLGTSPGSVIAEIEQLLSDLEPKCPVDSFELGRARLTLSRQPEPDDDPERVAFRREDAERTLTRWKQWDDQRRASLAKFDQFGGLAVHTDAKVDWDDDSQG